ncbi:MAG: substrate-binding domain-containing protein [Clostridia bacterium]
MLRKFLVTMLVLSLALVPSLAGAEATTYTIGFAVSTLENPFFVAMKDAAEVKAAELGVELMVLDAQDSAEAQASQVEDFITRGVDLLIINPVDSDAIGTAVVACNDAKIPVITVTRASNSGTVVQHLDIDNQEAGLLDAQQLIKDLGGKGNVAILEGIAGSSSAIDREKGFVTALEGTEIKVVASLTANYSREEGATVTEDILQSNPELQAIYAHNDEMALGAVRAVAAAGRSAEIKVYGIDATDDALAAVQNGEMAATVQQQPSLQIETALENALKYLKGETIEALVNIPLKLIVKE